MAEYRATIEWRRGDAKFTDRRFSRAHRWRFDGGLDVPASSSPHVVPVPASDPAAVDPEEAFVASLSSCHMLTFLFLAAKQGFVVDEYRDEAVGTLAKDAAGRQAVTVVTLHPAIRFGGEREPSRAELDALHHAAHDGCYIANSVTTDVRWEPVALGV
ncbi:MAG TPA: OsmC family protein [Methylomirabilota bacterium]|nr:OsmC family protein [Methylomirabilota bacterium]